MDTHTMKLNRIFLPVVLLALAAGAFAQHPQWKQLKGLKGVLVIVLASADGKDANPKPMVDDVELKLREAGIHVYDKSEALSAPKERAGMQSPPLLFVTVSVISNEAGYAATSVTMKLVQYMEIANAPGESAELCYWEEPSTSLVRTGAAAENVKAQIMDKATEFANDWLKAHPKE